MKFSEFQERYLKKEVVHFPSEVLEKPLVSVCVQTYEHANLIKNCLNGILNQKTTFPIEILVTEDNSSDGTREICKEFAQRHPEKIRLFLNSRENNISINGKPTGRFSILYNIFQAKGKYLAFCDGDDIWIDDNKLQKQVDFLENKPEIGLAACHIIKSEGPQKINIRTNRPILYHFEDLFNKVFTDLHHSTRVIRNTSLFQDLPDWHLRHLSFDTYLLYMTLKNIGTLAPLPFIGAIYTVHPGGIFSSIAHKNRGIKANELRRDLIDHGYFESKKDSLRFRRNYTGMKLWYHQARRGQFKVALRHLWQNLSLSFRVLIAK